MTDDEKLKVAFVSTWNTQCGIGTYTEDLVRALLASKAPVEPVIFAEELDSEHTESGTAKDLDVPVVRCWSRKSHDSTGLFAAMAEHEPKLIHFQHEGGLFASTPVYNTIVMRAKFLGTRVITTFHCLTGNINPSQPDAIVVHSPNAVELLPERFRGLATVIPHGTGSGALGDREKAREKLGIKPDEFVLATVGLMSANKNYACVINAVKSLMEKYPKLRYYIIGHPTTKAFETGTYWDKPVKQAGLEHVVIPVPGFLSPDGVRDVMTAIDAAIVDHGPSNPSASGSFRMLARYGVPAIVSQSAIFYDIPWNAAIRVKYDDPGDIAKAIRALIDDPDTRQKLVDGQKDFRAATSWETVAKSHVNLYKASMKTPRSVIV